MTTNYCLLFNESSAAAAAAAAPIQINAMGRRGSTAGWIIFKGLDDYVSTYIYRMCIVNHDMGHRGGSGNIALFWMGGRDRRGLMVPL